jgi:hypothetical protein
MIIACALPFHFGEIAMIGGGALVGAAVIGKLCWSYIKSKIVKKVKGCDETCDCECACNCCHHSYQTKNAKHLC